MLIVYARIKNVHMGKRKTTLPDTALASLWRVQVHERNSKRVGDFVYFNPEPPFEGLWGSLLLNGESHKKI